MARGLAEGLLLHARMSGEGFPAAELLRGVPGDREDITRVVVFNVGWKWDSEKGHNQTIVCKAGNVAACFCRWQREMKLEQSNYCSHHV